MRKEVEIIKRNQTILKKINESKKELLRIQKECNHNVVTEFLDCKNAHIKK